MIGGFIFEQQYHPKKDRIEVAELPQSLDKFCEAIPKDTRYRVLKNPDILWLFYMDYPQMVYN